MKYLWVEDFDGDSEDQDDKKERWKKYFSISDYILKCTLEDALSFLDNSDNKSKFDVVLLDIRFPVLSEESKKDTNKIYDLYFSTFITEEVFTTYANSEVLKDASSGILLFLALIFRYGYNWNNIAFVSANIDNDDLSDINILKELMTKVKSGEKLLPRDIGKYETIYPELLSEDNEYAEVISEIYNGSSYIPHKELIEKSDPEIISCEIEKLNKTQEELNKKIQEKNKTGLKYCSVRNEFKKIGLKMPPAFEKPTDESNDICWLFKDWIDSKSDKLTMVKRSIIDISDLLIKHMSGSANKFLKKQRTHCDKESNMTEETVKLYLQNILRNVANFPDIKSPDNEVTYSTNIIDSIVSIWERIKKPEVNDERKETYYDFAYYSVMKLTRNWMVHQGIKGIDIKFAAFVFCLSMKGIFDAEKLDDAKKLDDAEKLDPSKPSVRDNFHKKMEELIKLLASEPVVYNELNVESLMEKEYQRMCDRVKNAIPPGDTSMRIPETKDPFSLVSALGHEKSCSRESVSVKDLYKVFLMSIYFGDKNSKKLNPDKNNDMELIHILENVYSCLV